ncbi:hypothetical protein PF008_g10642 [Phytophthora fragariae]|uniref:Ubiquitin-like protease family profile domain-containing protein n=1 Tax=Phytophthora fragariae TaxID=53985 RepID=A0A6G0RT16_9STRA|nr:hypothetical protein PF008_g10642 [Phytophthora fragariae]
MEYLKQVARCVKNRDFKSPAALDLLTNDADRADSGASGTQSGIEIVDQALELVGKSALGDDTVNTLMLKMFAANVNTVVVDTSVAGNVMNGFMPVESMQKICTGVTKEQILTPVICGKNHWCSIMMDLMTKDVCIYDPMNSSYGVNLHPIADKLAMMVPNAAPRRYRVRAYHSDLGVQVDSYNCGVYMLLAFELFAGAENISQLSRKELQYLRYRYLCMCLN